MTKHCFATKIQASIRGILARRMFAERRRSLSQDSSSISMKCCGSTVEVDLTTDMVKQGELHGTAFTTSKESASSKRPSCDSNSAASDSRRSLAFTPFLTQVAGMVETP